MLRHSAMRVGPSKACRALASGLWCTLLRTLHVAGQSSRTRHVSAVCGQGGGESPVPVGILQLVAAALLGPALHYHLGQQRHGHPQDRTRPELVVLHKLQTHGSDFEGTATCFPSPLIQRLNFHSGQWYPDIEQGQPGRSVTSRSSESSPGVSEDGQSLLQYQASKQVTTQVFGVRKGWVRDPPLSAGGGPERGGASAGGQRLRRSRPRCRQQPEGSAPQTWPGSGRTGSAAAPDAPAQGEDRPSVVHRHPMHSIRVCVQSPIL